MNRTDRLLAMVLELQGRDLVTAEELAQTFEVTKRTIYRDILALNESGVPIVSAAGQGYWLMEGYFLPPVSLSPEEAVMLILGSDVMAKSFDAQYQSAAASASRKIEALLQENVQQDVTYLRENIRFFNADGQAGVLSPDYLPQLRSAIIEQKTIHINYRKPSQGNTQENTERFIDPHALLHLNTKWMLSAYCHMRESLRMFRLDRITALKLSDRTFTRQEGFDIDDLKGPDNRTLLIELLFNKTAAIQVKERPTFYISHYEDQHNGLKVHLKVRSIEEALPWILSWGANVKVLSPESLQDRIKKELTAMLEHTQGES